MHLIQILKIVKWPRKLLVSIFVLSVLTAGLALLLPMLAKNLLDLVSNNERPDIESVAVLVVIFVLNVILNGVSFYQIQYLGSHAMYQIREKVLAEVLLLPVPYYDNHETGIIMSRVIDDLENINSFITEKITNLFAQMMIIIGAITMLFILDWKLTLLIFTIIPITIFVILPIGSVTYKIAMKSQDAMADFTSSLNRIFSEIRLVKCYGAEQTELNHAKVHLDRILGLNIRTAKIQAITSPIITSTLLLFLAMIVGYGVYRIYNNTISPGTFVAIIFYLIQAIVPITSLASFYTDYKKTVGATEKLFQMCQETKEDIHISKRNLNLENQDAILEIQNVSFSYHPSKQNLKDISFKVPRNKITAIVGPSGSGKSTLFYLLERMYNPTSGQILYDNQNINDYALEKWRRLLGYVMQEHAIMNGTIKDNILYGLNQVSTEELRNSLSLSGCLEFIEKLPDGVDSMVGERGVKLSGGQKQRLSIARALLRNPSILLLDEATSNLDSESEKIVQQAIDHLLENRTTIIIAHRLSTIKNASQIIFLDNGKVTGIGTHEELIEKHTKYRMFVDTQSLD